MKKLLVLLCLLISLKGFSQSLSQEVIGSAGDYNTSAGSSLSWTLGEVMSETYSAGSNQLTQGFHQPTSKGVGLTEYSNARISVYPNPSKAVFHLNLKDAPSGLILYIYDARGRIVHTQLLSNSTNEIVDLTLVESGMYIIKFIHQSVEVFAPIKIQKTL